MKWINVFRLLTAGLVLTAISCSEPAVTDFNRPTDPSLNNSLRGARANYSLNWESISQMPTPPNTSTVDVPWAGSGESRQYDPALASDYKSADGWRLVYNTFSDQDIVPHQYFMLYNVYRGLLRLYYFSRVDWTPTNSENLTHTLSVSGGSSPLLNFADQDVVDLNTNSTLASKVEKFKTRAGTWYIYQYELAYDPAMSSRDNNFTFQWTINSNSISQIVLNGSSETNGTTSNSVQAPNIDLAFNSTNQGIGNIITTSTGQSESTSLLKVFSGAIVDGIKKSITDGVSGLVSGLLGGIFGSSGGNNTVEVKLKTTYNLQGSISNSSGLMAPVFLTPGTNISGSSFPSYTQVMGVYYLSAKPTVRVRRITGGSRDEMTTLYQLVDVPVIKNPVVESQATVEVIQTELLARVAQGTGSEKILGEDYDSGQQFEWPVGSGNELVGVRVTLRVTPSNGSAPVTLAKTFKAQLLTE